MGIRIRLKNRGVWMRMPIARLCEQLSAIMREYPPVVNDPLFCAIIKARGEAITAHQVARWFQEGPE